MRIPIAKTQLQGIMEFRELLRQEAMRKYNELDNEARQDLQKQYDFAKYDRKIQRMGGTFEDFLRFMFDFKIYTRKKNGKREYEIKPKNLRIIIQQKAHNLGISIKRIKEDYSIKLYKYKNGEIPFKEIAIIYKGCKKSLSYRQREFNKLQKLAKSLEQVSQ